MKFGYAHSQTFKATPFCDVLLQRISFFAFIDNWPAFKSWSKEFTTIGSKTSAPLKCTEYFDMLWQATEVYFCDLIRLGGVLFCMLDTQLLCAFFGWYLDQDWWSRGCGSYVICKMENHLPELFRSKASVCKKTTIRSQTSKYSQFRGCAASDLIVCCFFPGFPYQYLWKGKGACSL